jgi:hypothetical protein
VIEIPFEGWRGSDQQKKKIRRVTEESGLEAGARAYAGDNFGIIYLV